MKTSALTLTLVLLGLTTSSAQELRLRYTFDEPTGDSLDSSGFSPANTAVFQGGSTRTSDTPGGCSAGALDLTGSGSRYLSTVVDVEKVDGLSSYTFTTWLNLQGAPTFLDRLVVDSASATEASFQIQLVASSSGAMSASAFRLQMSVGDLSQAGPDVLVSGDLNADRRWIFLAATLDSLNDVGNFFLGTELTSVTPMGGGRITQDLVQNSAPFLLGGSGVSYLDATPPALIDDVRVYSGLANLSFLEMVRLQNVPEPGAWLLLALGGFTWCLTPRRK
jgi:hypothetical protein